ncbi:MATE family efflux transporter [Candidatus Providencia siddallii]|uniref:Multidrug-efflux transporter n=1 Tax=Candidatus Providencia siddallii TaxID=1715285 RepID=A0ABP1CG52_9GAMM
MQKYFIEARSLLTIGIPILLAQFSQTAMGFIDTVMAGSVSEIEMSAIAIGLSIWLPIILFGHGVLMALTPIIVQMNGSGRRKLIADQIQQGLWLAFFLALCIMFLLYNSNYFINNILHIDNELSFKSVRFLRAIMCGVPGYLFYQVYRSQCDGLSKTKPGMIIGFIGLIVNVPINYTFIYGRLGVPAFGGVGCGIATASVYWIMCIIMRWYIKKAPAYYDIVSVYSFSFPKFLILKRIIRLGLPIGLSLFFEVTLFAVVALFISPFGIVAVAAHQIALNFSSIMFIFPLSLGVASTIRVSYNLGMRSIDAAKVSSYTGLVVGFCVSCVTAIITAIFRESIAIMYNKNLEVVSLASNLMLFAAFYQLSDSIQVIGSGILRGYKDTRSIFFITFTAYWVLGLPFGYILSLTDIVTFAMGPKGFWIGFIIGLTSSAIGIVTRIYWIHKQTAFFIFLKSNK